MYKILIKGDIIIIIKNLTVSISIGKAAGIHNYFILQPLNLWGGGIDVLCTDILPPCIEG